MNLLIAGLALFFFIHLLPSLFAGPVNAGRQRLGTNTIKGLIAIGVLLGLVLIVLGWRSAVPQGIYTPPAALRLPAVLLLVLAVWLFAVSNRPSAVKRVLRHPQLTGLLLWSVAHLLVNGDSRSLTLFGGMAVWSVVEMLLINRRDGAREIPPAPPLKTDLVTAAMGVVGFLILVAVHPWLAGVSIIPAG